MRSNLFNRFFPVPRFLSSPSFGLDISDTSLKFIELINTKDGVKVGRYGERFVPEGVIKSGKIQDAKWMEETLVILRKEEGIKSVRVSLPEEQVYLFRLHLDKLGLVSIRESIELVLEEHVPISAEDAIFDYELLREDVNGLDLEVAAIPKNIIESYLTIFQNAQISVQSFELESQSIFRSAVKKGDMGTYMIVDFGETRTGIFIVSRGVMEFTSTLDIGGVTLVETIAKSFKISFEEAEKMKRRYGLQRNTENKEIFAVLLNSVSILRDELVKHFLYWNTHKDEKNGNNPQITKIILCGGGSNLTGLVDYFSVSIKCKVEMANVWVNVFNTENSVPEINFKQAVSFADAIGLALGDFESQF